MHIFIQKESIAVGTLITKISYLELNKILIYFALINPLILELFVETFFVWLGFFACGMLVLFRGGKCKYIHQWRVGYIRLHEMGS